MSFVKNLLTTIYCLPCIWTVLGFLGILGGVKYLLNTWTPYKGPLPSEGKIEGFASTQARKEFYDTTPMRAQAATKYAIIAGSTWLVVMVVLFLVLNRNTAPKVDAVSMAVTQTLAALTVTPTP
jgi:hypothetical protein